MINNGDIIINCDIALPACGGGRCCARLAWRAFSGGVARAAAQGDAVLAWRLAQAAAQGGAVLAWRLGSGCGTGRCRAGLAAGSAGGAGRCRAGLAAWLRRRRRAVLR